MNEQRHPTFLIDEAEKLSGKHADQTIIGLLNQGYRRGARVQRLREKNGGYVVDEFDAFGFRALAAIGSLWDTLIDRTVVISMKRKSAAQERRRHNGRFAEKEGKKLSQRICRFAQDNTAAFDDFQADTPRPQWLNDRACDNWSTLFTVAHLAKGEWPQQALDAAKALSNVAEDGDRAEQLIHDIRRIFTDKTYPEAIQSGELIEALSGIETSPWGDYNKGNGITMHKAAAILKPFEIRPRQDRDGSGEKIRGYWLKDLQETFKRYPPRSQLGQVGQPNSDGAFSDFRSGTEDGSCPSSESPETCANTGLSQLSHSEGRKEGKGWESDL